MPNKDDQSPNPQRPPRLQAAQIVQGMGSELMSWLARWRATLGLGQVDLEEAVAKAESELASFIDRGEKPLSPDLLRNWFSLRLRWRVLDACRRKRIERAHAPDVATTVQSSPSDAAEQVELVHTLRQELESLDAIDRFIIAARITSHLSWSEIAKLMDPPINEEAIRQRYSRALLRLRDRLH